MAFEYLGQKLAEVLDDFASVDLLIKSQTGPLFKSKETDTMFIITAYLKGYNRENIKIHITRDGTRIAISFQKPIHEIVMGGLREYKNVIEMRGFRKAFKIPNGVVCDKIEARFNEDESLLTILMPKWVGGVRGVVIEEVKAEEVDIEHSMSLQIVAHHITDREKWQHDPKEIQTFYQTMEKLPEGTQTKQEEFEESAPEKAEIVTLKKGLKEHVNGIEPVESTNIELEQVTRKEELPSLSASEKAPIVEEHKLPGEIPRNGSGKEGTSQGNQEPEEPEYHTKLDQTETSGLKQPTDKDQVVHGKEVHGTEEEKLPPRKSKLCAPIFVGSALLVSLVVLTIHFIRTKNQPRKNKR